MGVAARFIAELRDGLSTAEVQAALRAMLIAGLGCSEGTMDAYGEAYSDIDTSLPGVLVFTRTELT